MDRRGRLKRVCLGLIGVGMALVLAGFAASLAGGSSVYLSEQDAKEYLDAAVALHGKTMPKKGESVSAESVELTRARRRYVDARDKVDTARQTRAWLPSGLKLAGSLLAGAGLVGLRANP